MLQQFSSLSCALAITHYNTTTPKDHDGIRTSLIMDWIIGSIRMVPGGGQHFGRTSTATDTRTASGQVECESRQSADRRRGQQCDALSQEVPNYAVACCG